MASIPLTGLFCRRLCPSLLNIFNCGCMNTPVATLRWLVWWCGDCKTTLQLSVRWCGGDGGSGADKFAHTARPHASGACELVLEPRTHGGRSPWRSTAETD